MYKVLLEVYCTYREYVYSAISCAMAIQVIEFENQEDATNFFVNIVKEEIIKDGCTITRKATCLNF